ncbi:hypothetical protein GMLC_07120 [Geomonas limicola]|uniref:Molybdopterin synthase sulfur carrier subunit n=1 Tax=Geomonas limicola TaxID=2740186 RepID=A0A6V8N6E1_9BACT|nr:MoaD/ThiS family protein [Geomonas limicola]GFO67133.1 hypothetical protein GMLC_07120 [Geomonas limicola]
MQVTIKLFAALRWKLFEEEVREYPEGTTVAQLAADLGIPAPEIGIRLVNGRHCPFEQVLQDGDTVFLMPPIGGG